MHVVRVGTASRMCHLSPVCTERDAPTSPPSPAAVHARPGGRFFFFNVEAVQQHAREETLTFQLQERRLPSRGCYMLIL